MPKINKLSREEIVEHQRTHEFIVKYVDGLYEQSKQHFNIHNLSMLLIDEDGYVIKNYALPFFQRVIEDIQGMRVLEEDVGTSSISIAREHNVPFLMFGPEMWIKDSHSGDACSAPICVDGKIRYIISFFSLDQNDLPYDLLLSLLLTMKYAIEQHLKMLEYWSIQKMMMEELPVAVYWIGQDEKLKYCNSNAKKRLEGRENLEDIFLNYEHIPIKKALQGTPTHRREITWITQDRTYEDITTVMPVKVGSEVESALVMSMSIEDLKTTIAHATGYSSRYSLYSMVGETSEFLALQHKASRIARSDNNILLQGEPGTGKQRLAHGIHQASPRAAAPLIVVKCSNAPLSTLEEEFFGSEDGDHQPTAGKLELSMGGTLFLDEVGNLAPETQQMLLRAIQERRYRPIGDKTDKSFNVRIIAATNEDLGAAVNEKRFRQDLLYRLHDFEITVPPLRDCQEDIMPLAEFFREIANKELECDVIGFDGEARKTLLTHVWPGNVRELRQKIMGAVLQAQTGLVTKEHLELAVTKQTSPVSFALRNDAEDKERILRALKQANGNRKVAAELLGIGRTTLYSKLEEYGLKYKFRQS